MIRKAFFILRSRGVSGLLHAARSRIRGLLAGRAKSFPLMANLFVGKSGIEIGGPSHAFSKRGIFPVYPIIEHLDNCNFDRTTVWEGTIEEGQTFRFDPEKPLGRQYLGEATAMEFLPSGAYDFVLASHVLEHCANPILALSEWMRLLKDKGLLVLILPHKDKTFDHRRPVTTIEHLITDFEARTTECDLTHLPEILALHDLNRDPEAGDITSFNERCRNNFENRCLHHHVFDTALAAQLVTHMGMVILAAEVLPPFHILVVSRKLAATQAQPKPKPETVNTSRDASGA